MCRIRNQRCIAITITGVGKSMGGTWNSSINSNFFSALYLLLTFFPCAVIEVIQNLGGFMPIRTWTVLIFIPIVNCPLPSSSHTSPPTLGGSSILPKQITQQCYFWARKLTQTFSIFPHVRHFLFCTSMAFLAFCTQRTFTLPFTLSIVSCQYGSDSVLNERIFFSTPCAK